MIGIAHRASRMLAMMLIGLGVATLLRTIGAEGENGLRVGYLVGPALIVAGVARIKLSNLRSRGDSETHDRGNG